jgi:D-glycero-alpha-D-manno-heptose-7-phosphate kinase
MIITRTPLRVTLGGGGTDLQSYYGQSGGFIFAMALNKYIYVKAHRPAFESDIVVHGQSQQKAIDAQSLPEGIVRSALMRHQITDRFEAASLGEIQGGTGLGSSSCFLVGFLRALHEMRGTKPSTAELAEEACDIEITRATNGIGKQDQYMAAFGGLTRLDIAKDGKVEVSRVELKNGLEDAFVSRTRIYYTGLRRDAAAILNDQNSAMRDDQSAAHTKVANSLDAIKDLGYRIHDAWTEGRLEDWGQMLHEHWTAKKMMSAKISWPHIDEIYNHARSHYGVLGGKIIGAGGGGFLMLFTLDEGGDLDAYMQSQNMPRLDYAIDKYGSQIVA